VVAYDRRGFGETTPSVEPFSHVDDLLAVLDQVADGAAWLVGASAGGGLALDTALVAPERVAGLVLLGSAVSGAPAPELDAETERLGELIDQAIASGDLDEANRLETWVWLDGPAGPEGRVTGAARSLALDMNAIILRNGVPEDAGDSGVDAWNRLDEVRVPVTVACGDLDDGRAQPRPGSDELLGGVNPVPFLSCSNLPFVLATSPGVALPPLILFVRFPRLDLMWSMLGTNLHNVGSAAAFFLALLSSFTIAADASPALMSALVRPWAP
jgi:pimeloyl-ACP methyl ester carboxylesterase